MAAASGDQEAVDFPLDLEVQEEVADQEEADSAGQVAQVGRMAAVRGDLEVQDTRVGQVVLEDLVADRRPLPRHMGRAPQRQLTEHHET